MLTPNDIAAVPELEALAARMLPEVLATPRSAWVPMPAATMYKGDWLALLFSAGPWAQEFPGVDLAANLERFPEAAALLARNELGIDEIARLCGFADRGYLTRIFGRRMGITPARYRHLHAQEAIAG